jgi:hypothetical protein
MFNNNTYSKALTATLLVVLISAQSCKKSFLEVPVQGQTTSATFFTTTADATAAVASIYAGLRSYDEVAFPAIAVESMDLMMPRKAVLPAMLLILPCTITLPLLPQKHS